MALTFRSSRPEVRVFIDREPDGRQRLCRAERFGGERQWQLTLEHPDGQQWSGTFNGDANELPLAMGMMLADKQNEFVQAKQRGDKPPAPVHDASVPVDATGNYLAATIVPRR